MKLLTVIGARPQFIKAAVVSRAIKVLNRSRSHQIEEVIVHSGQHYDINMSDVFFAELDIPAPNHRLNLTKTEHGAMTGEILEGVERIITEVKPDIVLVYGDTNTTLAGALAASKFHVPIAHVEAGLRSFNMRMPEEINRVLTDRISRWLFCPSQAAAGNLEREGARTWQVGPGIQPEIDIVGDVMLDAALYYKEKAKPTDAVKKIIGHTGGQYYLSTLHRAENVNDLARLKTIFRALSDISRKRPVIMPLHPRTRNMLPVDGSLSDTLIIIDPVGYLDMITLLANCQSVFTDSGGLQKEAYYFGKPCITLRDETEWVELTALGCNILTGANYAKIIDAENQLTAMKVENTLLIYGNGDAGGKIVNILARR